MQPNHLGAHLDGLRHVRPENARQLGLDVVILEALSLGYWLADRDAVGIFNDASDLTGGGTWLIGTVITGNCGWFDLTLNSAFSPEVISYPAGKHTVNVK